MTRPTVGSTPTFSLAGLWSQLRGERLTAGAMMSLAINGAGAFVSFGVQIAAARFLGEHGFGAYLYALAWMNAVQVLGRLEIDRAAVRFIGAYHATASLGLLRGFRRWSSRVLITASTLCAGIGALLVLLLRDAVAERGSSTAVMLWACALLPVSAYLLLQSATLQGYKSIARAQLPTIILRPALTLVALLVCWWLIGSPLSPSLAVVSNVAATVLTIGITAQFIRSVEPAGVQVAAAEERRSEWVSTSRALLVVGGAQLVLSQQADLLFVGTLLDTQQVGIYGAASLLASTLGFVVTSVAFVAAPLIADYHAREQHDELQQLIFAVRRLNLWATIPFAIVMAAFGLPLLRLFGPGFGSGYTVLLVLAASQAVGAVVGSVGGFVATMTDMQREAAHIAVWSALLNLMLTFLLTPHLGINGAAIATLVAAVARAAALVVLIRRRKALRLL